MKNEVFPIDLSLYKPVVLDLQQERLTDEQRKQLKLNIQLLRDSIVFFTALAGVRGFGGHTGGAYDIVPEVLIADGFMRKPENNVCPIFWDEAGHRVAIQYIMAALDEGKTNFTLERLFHYREHGYGLYGHPEKDTELGIDFSSGRLGHLWSYINGVALAYPSKRLVLFGSDGSQQEGNDAEAARFAVAQQLNITLCIDDNNITISGHPHDYMKGYDLKKTLQGHGLIAEEINAENIDALYSALRIGFLTPGPVALINKRKMAVGIKGVEDTPHGHDVISKDAAVTYLSERNYSGAVQILKSAVKTKDQAAEYLGSSKELGTNRSEFGKIICGILSGISEEKRKSSVRVFDCDLEGSTGIKSIREIYPQIYIQGGIMERHNFSAAAGFGNASGKQGIFATFSAFSEMVVSEITMARLNYANVLSHFSHAGVDWMADNTCHYGINLFFVDNALPEEDTTRLYFPADVNQLRKVLMKIFSDQGLRFVFTTRSSVPFILKENGEHFYNDTYEFQPDKDEIIRELNIRELKTNQHQNSNLKNKHSNLNYNCGYIVSYGDMLYRCLDAVERLNKEGIIVGLINKPVLNVVDEQMMKKLGNSEFVLVVENQNVKTGLGSRFGTWLLERGFSPNYAHIGVSRLGKGGVYEHISYQGLDSLSIQKKVKEMLGIDPY